ncbi:MAG: hypothetical protein FWH36_06745, partial [Lentimicrobiaceae bacterium]|nr:hypothetical protein [Lentimicrobiaceae bacterium]
MKRIGILFLFFVLTLAAGYGQNSLLLSSSNGFSSNYVQLHWTWTPSKPAGNYSFTLFQWDNALGDWQSTSVKCDDTIRVLNVYPDIAGSNTLKTWMDDPSIGFGKILVTSVSITNFNNNPDSYLKNGSGEYIYDVIAFGFYNANNNKDLSPSATVAVRAFLDAGRGVL